MRTMSTYKKIDNSQKILNSPPTTHPYEQNHGDILSKLNIKFYEFCGFYAARFLISRSATK